MITLIGLKSMARSRPETVGELIDALKLFPPHFPIDFGYFTLFQLKDRGDVCSFEFNEHEGTDYEMLNRKPMDLDID